MELVTRIAGVHTTPRAAPSTTASRIAAEMASRERMSLRRELSRANAEKSAAVRAKEESEKLLQTTMLALHEANTRIAELEAKVSELEARTRKSRKDKKPEPEPAPELNFKVQAEPDSPAE